MPGVYKEKACLECGKAHRKRGPFCSQACSNTHREVKVTTREKLSQVAKEYKQTPEGIASSKKLRRDHDRYRENEEKRQNGEYVLQEDDWYVIPGGTIDTEEEFKDNDNWQEVDNDDNSW